MHRGQETHRKHHPSLQSLQPSRSGSPVVILQDAQTAPKASPAGGHKPETIRLVTKDFVRDVV